MKLYGTLKGPADSKGSYQLVIRGLPIPVRGDIEKYVGSRVCIFGQPFWKDGQSYLQVESCDFSTHPDIGPAIVTGKVIRIFPERTNARGRRSACVLLQRTEDPSSTVLVTALSSNVDKLDLDNLSIGEKMRVGGYISAHSSGLHVLLTEQLYKKGANENHV